MGAQLDRLRYEVFQNLFYSPMNTGILRAAVATAPTVYGIETTMNIAIPTTLSLLQQHLPFTVLKQTSCFDSRRQNCYVATAPTVYGIETLLHCFISNVTTVCVLQQHLPFTVLKPPIIEIMIVSSAGCNSTYRLRY